MATSTTLPWLPMELIEEILVWTPAEFLVRAKWTCKEWCRLINQERFIHRHVALSAKRMLRNDETRLLRSSSETVQIMDLVTRKRAAIPTPHEFPPSTVTQLLSFIHCDGLMLCTFGEFESFLPILALWNPLTSEFRRVEHRLSLVEHNEESLRPIKVSISSRLADGNVSFSPYFTVDIPNLPSLCSSSFRDFPVYFINPKNKCLIVWCAGRVTEGDWVSICVNLYEINGSGVTYEGETERGDAFYYTSTFQCGYVYVPSLLPLP